MSIRPRSPSRSRSISPRKRFRPSDVLPPRLQSPPRACITAYEIGAILAYRRLRFGARAISKLLGISVRHVQNVIANPDTFAIRDCERPESHCGDTSGAIRTRAAPDIVIRLLITVTWNPLWPLRDVLEHIRATTGRAACRERTAERILTAAGFVRRRRTCRPLLKASHYHPRVLFCRMLLCNPAVADDMIFTDESYVEFHSTGTHKICFPGEKAFTSEKPKCVRRFLVWSAVGLHVGLMPFVCIPVGTMVNAALYRSIIEDHFIPWLRLRHKDLGGNRRYIFQQDNASAHTAGMTTDALDTMFGHLRAEGIDVVRLSEWPANSPDISPIESVWAILKGILRRMRRQRVPLWMALTFAHWSMHRPTFIHKLWASWRECVWSVLRLDGGNHHTQTAKVGCMKPPSSLVAAATY
eukprot:TRINITY_DN1661_c0_g1_i2.p2 TRINITY_DN1661_c0_g1~~TRINITY_DN1661_c0_g1_i2.p2  ORF type:complete len:412 (-),score=52.46 TRINITY_DN1661_c0_g1_i2:1496-2731(-)